LDSKSCFTENYFVYSLFSEKRPQLTQTYLNKEDDVLDFAKVVNFSRNTRRLQYIANSFEFSINNVNQIPDEIDGDERGSDLIEREPITIYNRRTKPSQQAAVDESMFIDNNDAKTRIKRYSVVSNDPTYKSYTKN
jgi:hypothetical protein